MSTTRKNKNASPARSYKSPRKLKGDGAVLGSENDLWAAADDLQELSEEKEEVSSTPRQDFPEGEYDEELILTFLTFYHALEQALVRAGYSRAGRTSGHPQPDWIRFTKHIEGYFDPDSSVELQGAVAYLLSERKNFELRLLRLRGTYPWEASSPHNDLIWLSEIVQQTGNRLAHGINFPVKPGCNTAQVMAALFVVVAWSAIDPEVEGMLPPGL